MTAAAVPGTVKVCSGGLLALADVQALVTDSPAEGPLSPDDNAEVWSHGCAWQAGGMALVLIVQGALNATGNLVLAANVDVTSDSTRQAAPVAGVGDKAIYLVDMGLGPILNANQGNELVSVQASGYLQPVPESSLEPLALEALGNLFRR